MDHKQQTMMEFRRLHKAWEDADWQHTLAWQARNKAYEVHLKGVELEKEFYYKAIEKVLNERGAVKTKAMEELEEFIERLAE